VLTFLCILDRHNGTIFDKPREKTGLAIKTRWSPRESKIDLRLG
jgi:hypothetical protein